MSRSDGADQRPTVLMVGPDVGAIGGMGAVARTLATSADARGHHHVELLGSGGGRGPSGWIAWPGALARAASMPADVMHLHVASNGSTWRKASFAVWPVSIPASCPVTSLDAPGGLRPARVTRSGSCGRLPRHVAPGGRRLWWRRSSSSWRLPSRWVRHGGVGTWPGGSGADDPRTAA